MGSPLCYKFMVPVLDWVFLAVSIVALTMYKNSYGSVTATYEKATQINFEWNRRVITDIIPVQAEDCPDDYKEIFARNWLGIDQACLVRRSSGEEVWSLEDYKKYAPPKNHQKPECLPTNPFPPKQQSPFFGVKLCGKQG